MTELLLDGQQRLTALWRALSDGLGQARAHNGSTSQSSVVVPRSSVRRAQRKAETRAALITAATEVFSEVGYQAASLSTIGRRAGYTTGAIYWHFSGKEELFLAVFEQYALTRVGELGRISEAESEVAELPDRLRIFADHWMERQNDDPSLMIVALEFFVHSLRHPELREAFATRQAAVRLAVARVLEQEAREDGIELPLPAEELATVLRELGVGLAMAKLVDPAVCRDELYGDFVEVLFRLVLGQDPSIRALHQDG